ncbi:MAG TPA: hypothetical protein VE130_06065 [Nitrososphaeraceae archaeon]|nr:hypothetical protein [Nitrososphaeraceae archaeon]
MNLAIADTAVTDLAPREFLGEKVIDLPYSQIRIKNWIAINLFNRHHDNESFSPQRNFTSNYRLEKANTILIYVV